ncbi:hypothetical protein SAY86_015771 [Trapa natans]|uniref:Uncharacterized protein n=1 Tax=Trapa natans TaxID=22666 RepID=A0AAN7QVT5_TRANT|nr:hypothetical protein SAY86_015771 [Trapa natans]
MRLVERLRRELLPRLSTCVEYGDWRECVHEGARSEYDYQAMPEIKEANGCNNTVSLESFISFPVLKLMKIPLRLSQKVLSFNAPVAQIVIARSRKHRARIQYISQIKGEILIMKLCEAPLVGLHEVHHGRLSEAESQKYFQQLIDAGKFVLNGVEHAEFSCPSRYPVGAKSLIQRILDPNHEMNASWSRSNLAAHEEVINLATWQPGSP